jgi:hypothetical protein
MTVPCFKRIGMLSSKKGLNAVARDIGKTVENNWLLDLAFTALMLVFTPAIIWLFQA